MNDRATAGVIARPPRLFLAVLLLGLALDRLLPLSFGAGEGGAGHWIIAGSLILIGLALGTAAIRNFGRAGTPVPTIKPDQRRASKESGTTRASLRPANFSGEPIMPNERKGSATTRAKGAREIAGNATTARFHGVRYQVKDVERSAAFYSTHLGFKVEHQQLPAFATLSLGPLHLLLSGPGASGSRDMPDGRVQEPGGWNRIVLRVSDLASWVEQLQKVGLRFRNEVETGPAGKQIQLEDPDGNPVELFEPRQ